MLRIQLRGPISEEQMPVYMCILRTKQDSFSTLQFLVCLWGWTGQLEVAWFYEWGLLMDTGILCISATDTVYAHWKTKQRNINVLLI